MLLHIGIMIVECLLTAVRFGIMYKLDMKMLTKLRHFDISACKIICLIS